MQIFQFKGRGAVPRGLVWRWLRDHLLCKCTSLSGSLTRSCSSIISNAPRSSTYPYCHNSWEKSLPPWVHYERWRWREEGKRKKKSACWTIPWPSPSESHGPVGVPVWMSPALLCTCPQPETVHIIIPAPNLLYCLNHLTLKLQKRPHPTLHRILMIWVSLPLRRGWGTNPVRSQEVTDFLGTDPPVHTWSLQDQTKQVSCPSGCPRPLRLYLQETARGLFLLCSLSFLSSPKTLLLPLPQRFELWSGGTGPLEEPQGPSDSSA